MERGGAAAARSRQNSFIASNQEDPSAAGAGDEAATTPPEVPVPPLAPPFPWGRVGATVAPCPPAAINRAADFNCCRSGVGRGEAVTGTARPPVSPVTAGFGHPGALP